MLAEDRDPDGMFANWRISLSPLGYNTNLVKPEEAPRSFAVDAIREAETLAERAKELPKAALDRLLTSGYGIFAGERVQWATLKFTPSTAFTT